VSSAAKATEKPPRARMRPPPMMSPMYPSGRGKSVSTGMRSGTVKKDVKATTGAATKTQLAPSGASISLRKSLAMS
jgi:hypothetical protein